MPLTSAQHAALMEDFNAEQFAPLDLSAFVDLQEQPATEARDDRWSRDWRDTPLNASAAALRAFVTDPPLDVLDRVGQETGNDDFRAEVRDRKGELVATAFMRECPDYFRSDANYRAIAETVAFNSSLSASEQEQDIDEVVALLIERGFWIKNRLVDAYHALREGGYLDVAEGSTRALTSAERLRVTRLAQSGRVDAAIGEHLKCALDGEEPGLSILDDPNYLGACNSAVYAVFSDTQFDYSPTPEHEDYLSRYAGSRPLTLELLRQAWKSCQANEQRHERSELLSPLREQDQAPSERELNALNDDEVDRLYRASLREYVRSIKAPGVLL